MATIDELVTAAESQYIPGVNYTGYFNAAINAAKRAGQQQEAETLSRLKESWNAWSQTNTLSGYTGTKTKIEAKKLADAAQAVLNDQTKAINDVNAQFTADLKAAKTSADRDAITAAYASKLMDAVYTAEDKATEASKTFAAGPVADTTSTTDAKAAYDEWKKTGLDPNITDPKVLAEYQALKAKDQGVTNVTSSGVKGPVYSSALTLADALKDYGDKKLLPNKSLNAPLYDELINRIAAGKGTANAPTDSTAFAKYLASKPQGVKVDLPADYAARSAVQDIMLSNMRSNPGMYATGQLDPFYSGVARTSMPANMPANVMNESGVFTQGVGAVAPNPYGYGFQNAYQPNTTNVGADTVTGAAAGGYMDAQVINQQNQALQQPNNQTLGLGSIPNMSQYRDYQNNPGITSSTQIGDDGNTGGVPVPGQTNPIW